jgi:hypothetical protein
MLLDIDCRLIETAIALCKLESFVVIEDNDKDCCINLMIVTNFVDKELICKDW